MIHISRTKKKEFIKATVSSRNGKLLDASEPEKRSASIWKNIIATGKENGSKELFVQDDTVKGTPKVFLVKFKSGGHEIEQSDRKPEPRYESGKNVKWKKLFRNVRII